MKPELPPTAAPRSAAATAPPAVPDPPAADTVRWALRAEPHGLHEVRRRVLALLRAWGREELVLAAAMCVTELLSNVHKHAASPLCELEVRSVTGGVRVSVTDRDPRMPVPREPDHLSESGRGLFLLAGTVDAWGARRVPGGGKAVWFTLLGDGSGR